MTLEVYNQRQNALSTFECVEHRMFKVTWARLCVYSDICTTVHVFGWARGSAVRDARLGWARLGKDASTVRS